jgi:two-component system NarL family sensor kinase
MYKSVLKLFILVFVFLLNVPLLAEIRKSHNKEFSHTKTSFVITRDSKDSKDSNLDAKYKQAKSLYENKRYVESLQTVLYLNEQVKTTKNSYLKFKIVLLIADIYKNNRDHKKAISYYKKSLKLLTNNILDVQKIDSINQKYLAENLLRLGGQYQYLGKKDSAIFYYEKLAVIPSLNDDIASFQAMSFSNLSGIYQYDTTHANHKEKALESAKKAIDILQNKNNKLGQAAATNNLGNIYLLNGNFKQSKKTYLEGIRLIKGDTSMKAIKRRGGLYFNLSMAMRNLNDYRAYEYLDTARIMKSQVRDLETKEKLERVTAEFNVSMVRKEGKLQKKEAENLTWIVGTSFFSVILLLAFLLNQYKLRQRNLSLQLSKQELVQQQKIEKVRSESQIRILNATLDGKETERKQISETLHDSVSALLSSANLHLQACKKIFNGPIPIELEKSQDIIVEASQIIRDLSHTLVSSVLLKFGLANSIKDLAYKYSNSQLEVIFQTKNIQRYDQDFEIKLYNIIQELVNNAIKHSEASIAEINLVEKDKKILLTINDNGNGFDTSKMSQKEAGLGINQIDARIHMMGGKFIIDSKKGKGTKISIELPVYMKNRSMFS